jgi:hypothetical protein
LRKIIQNQFFAQVSSCGRNLINALVKINVYIMEAHFEDTEEELKVRKRSEMRSVQCTLSFLIP